MITVLRLNHRVERDKRITTHCALVARALGADEMVYTGDRDEAIEKSVSAVASKWGGGFVVRHAASWKRELARDAIKVHLTMYGEKLADAVKKIPKGGDVVIVIGGEKVPWEVYEKCDYNVAVGSQPHSEVSALALFMYEYFGKNALDRDFKGAKIRLKPSPRGKIVENLEEGINSSIK